MGGEFEKTVPSQSTPKSPGNAAASTSGSIRMHLNNNEVHFHNDAESLKVAVPYVDWYKFATSINTSDNIHFTYVDHVNNTLLNIDVDWLGDESSSIKITALPAKDSLAQTLLTFIKDTVRS